MKAVPRTQRYENSKVHLIEVLEENFLRGRKKYLEYFMELKTMDIQLEKEQFQSETQKQIILDEL